MKSQNPYLPKSAINKNAPLWMQRVTSILLLLQAAKPWLINGFPGIQEAHAAIAGQVFDYIASLISLIFAILTIVLGTEEKKKGSFYGLILLCLIATMLSGCYTPNKAARQIVKAQVVHPELMREACASFYPNNDSTHILETIIAGDTIVFTDTIQQYHTDTVNQLSYRYITKTLAVRDTLTRTVYQQVVNKAKELHLEGVVATLQTKEASLTTTNRYLWIGISILTMYTVGRWVLRATTKINLP